MYEVEFLGRYFHVLAGIVWIGMLYYFNFVQTEYFKEAEAAAKSDAMAKLAPRALWWFRWGAMLTFLTGAYFAPQSGCSGRHNARYLDGCVGGHFYVPQRLVNHLAQATDRARYERGGWTCRRGQSRSCESH